MEMYSININANYLKVNFGAVVTIKDIKLFCVELLKLSKFKRINVLADFRETKVEISEVEIEYFCDSISRYKPKINANIALIHSDPILTAYTYMILNMLEENRHSINLFSTTEGALKWISEFRL